MSQPITPAEKFVAAIEATFHIDWWVSLWLRDCGELVYKHAIGCPCGRTVTEAFDDWKRYNPEQAAQAAELLRAQALRE